MTSYRRQDALITLLGLGLLTAWDSAGLDLPLMRSLGNAGGFIWREAATLQWLHTTGRTAAWAVLAWMGWMAFTAPNQIVPTATSARGAPENRRYWFGITLACLLLISLIKHASATSCPWDLAEFGGVAQYVSHWALWARDSGSGHCFPSGHTSAAAAFVSLYFLHRRSDPRRAKLYLACVFAASVVFSMTQIVRGAHYPSHALWSFWLCWAMCGVGEAWLLRHRSMQAAVQQ